MLCGLPAVEQVNPSLQMATREPHMSETPASLSTPPEGYGDWLTDLKGRIHGAQQRATLAVNR